jgi:hypothetical protein
VLYAAAGGRADTRDLGLLPDPLRTVASRCLSEDPADRPSARSAVARLLGLGEPYPGVLSQGCSRAALAAWRPRPVPDRPPPRPRSRRAVTIWSAGIAACVVAAVLAVVAFLLVSQGHTAASGGKPAATSSAPGTKPSHSGRVAGPSATVPAALAGTWSGQVSQTAPADTFTVQVSLAAGASSGTVQYSGTSLSCTGKLTVESGSPGSLRLSQVITHGPCADGTVMLTSGPHGSAGFSFQGKQGPAATGTLSKA